MSILKGKLGRSAVVVAFSLGAFQALSVIGATSAFAVSTCSFAGGVVTVSAPANGDTVKIYQDDNGGIHVAGDVALAEPAVDGTDDIAACNGSQFSVATTTTINVTGATGVGAFDQSFYIEMTQVDVTPPPAVPALNTVLEDWGTINWLVNGGNNTAAGDSLFVSNNGLTTAPLDVAAGANGIDLNNDGDLDVTTANVENFTFFTFSDADVQNIDLGGTTATGAAFPTDATVSANSLGDDSTYLGGAGDDTMSNISDGVDNVFSPGLGNDTINCGPGENDWIDYSNTDTAINLNLAIFTVTQGTDLDTITPQSCENAIGTGQGDTMIGDIDDNTFMPGAGNDIVTGGLAGENEDTYDVSDATDAVTVDLNAGTSTGGSGTDTLTEIEDVVGGAGNDDITGEDGAFGNVLSGGPGNDKLSGGSGDGDGPDTFDGGSGIDTLSYENNTLATNVDLNDATPSGIAGELDSIVVGPPSIENAILGSGDDTFFGSVFNNIVWPNGGQNALTDGGALGGGIDTVNYSIGYTAGVVVNLSGGGQAGGSAAQDSITGFENAVGTAFNDTLIGTDLVAATNGANLLVGGKGNDNISANAGPDLVRAGAGNDHVRGGSGDDTLMGQGGKDNIRGGTGDDDIFGGKGKDFCVGGGGHDFIKTCERPRHHHQGPNGPGVARLSAIKP